MKVRIVSEVADQLGAPIPFLWGRPVEGRREAFAEPPVDADSNA
jgi:hypothetical protein